VAVIGSGAIGIAIVMALARLGIGRITVVDTSGPMMRPDNGELPSSALLSEVETQHPGVRFTWINDILDSPDDIAAIASEKDVLVVALDAPRVGLHEIVNHVCLEKRIPWMTCGNLRSVACSIGPFFVPYETCCYTCYDRRMKSNLEASLSVFWVGNGYIRFPESWGMRTKARLRSVYGRGLIPSRSRW